MRVLIAGASGMVGRAVAAYCATQNDQVLAYDRQSLDITDHEKVRTAFERHVPEAVINCAAWTDVDGCERDHRRAYAVNAYAVEALAVSSRRVGAVFVTISTDYVFDGSKDGFYTQRDDPNPQSVYAASKLEGERRAQAACARTIVVRTGWLFGEGGRNFLSTVIDRAHRGERLTVINDSYGAPTYAGNLARRLRELAGLDIPGIYHVVNQGMGASYEEFANAALKAADCTAIGIESVSMSSLSRPASRPRNSRLKCILSEAIGLAPLPDWKVALNDFVARNYQITPKC